MTFKKGDIVYAHLLADKDDYSLTGIIDADGLDHYGFEFRVQYFNSQFLPFGYFNADELTLVEENA